MSQFRVRKVPSVANGDCGRNRPFTAKASGDAVACDLRRKETYDDNFKHHDKRSRSKNKIPKNVRNDLESALVGLCDVWFEDIKPHLIRNNIKVHFHGAPPESGDHDGLAAHLTDCSHVDPGAASDRHRRRNVNCAACCSRQPTVSKARCRRLSTPSAQPVPPPQMLPSLQLTTPRHRKCKGESQKTHISSKSKYDWRVPRLCHTYSNLSPAASPRHDDRRIRTASPKKPRQRNQVYHEKKAQRAQKKDKSTQTEPVIIRSPITMKKLQSPNLQEANNRTQIPIKLFPDDLIDKIVESHDKKLKLLYLSPHRDEYPSILSLARNIHNADGVREPHSTRKQPWR
ncbi:uncharacterized protein LOC114250901 [Bombyx mandarina]|uniref:Uncharacterized protein LOC114250901 n=1 Tax=Bombyx mandarina TaxID=7092 RepID=A0A6J2KIK6_BOMMA|nr:uncharacterized protein LOC114250901 [Bombyx mandarina]